MNKLFRRIFFGIGLLAIVWMLMHFDWQGASLLSLFQQTGFYFPLVLLLWLGIYAINTCSWSQLIRAQGAMSIPWWKLYKFTVSGFALNYVTPGGLNGGEPYRILELRPYLGTAKATSSTILYVLVHVASHLLFWAIAAIYIAFSPWGKAYLSYSILICAVVGLLLLFFHYLMKKGLAQLLSSLLHRIPFLGSSIQRLEKQHATTIQLIDHEVRQVYSTARSYLFSALCLEFLARLLGCLEVWLLAMPLMGSISFMNCYLIMAIASLMGNILFFMPMQLGGREGGFSLAFSLLSFPASYGLLISLMVRLRELVWIVLGVVLIQLGSKTKEPHS